MRVCRVRVPYDNKWFYKTYRALNVTVSRPKETETPLATTHIVKTERRGAKEWGKKGNSRATSAERDQRKCAYTYFLISFYSTSIYPWVFRHRNGTRRCWQQRQPPSLSRVPKTQTNIKVFKFICLKVFMLFFSLPSPANRSIDSRLLLRYYFYQPLIPGLTFFLFARVGKNRIYNLLDQRHCGSNNASHA